MYIVKCSYVCVCVYVCTYLCGYLRELKGFSFNCVLFCLVFSIFIGVTVIYIYIIIVITTS